MFFFFFFFNDTATTEIYTLSLHDALPIYVQRAAQTVLRSAAAGQPDGQGGCADRDGAWRCPFPGCGPRDRKSTRLNSSHSQISYAVFCLKKKKNKHNKTIHDNQYLNMHDL